MSDVPSLSGTQRREPTIHEKIDSLLKGEESIKIEKRQLLQDQAYRAYAELSTFYTALISLSASGSETQQQIRQYLEWMQAEFDIQVPEAAVTEILQKGI
jgi:hypothetical protein